MFLIIGILTSAVGGIWLWSRIDYVRGSMKVEAKIIAIEKRPGGKGPPAYIPIFQLETARGRLREIKSQASYVEEIQIGNIVPVLFNDRNRAGPLIDDGFRGIYGAPFYIFSFGAVWTVLSIIGLRSSKCDRNIISHHEAFAPPAA